MIEKIVINNWKGHKAFSCKFDKGLNFIIGPNGIGKSSILEAIYYGITGEVKSKTSLKKMKTIDSDGPMKVEINLIKNNTKYKIERINDRNTTVHHFYNLTENYKISGKKKVEKEILKLYDTKKLFLKRMFYYGEGDIFRVITSSRARGKTNFKDYIEDYLGMKKLKEFQDNIRDFKSNFYRKRKEFDYEVEQMISLNTEKEFSEEKKNLMRRKEILKGNVKTVEKHLNNLERQNLMLKQKVSHIDDIVKASRDLLNVDLFDTIIQNQIKLLKEEIDKDQKELRKVNIEIEQKSKKLEKIEKEVISLKNIVNLLKNLEVSKLSSCPVCDRLFDDASSHSAFEKLKLFEESQKINAQTKSELEKLHYTYQSSNQILEKKVWLLDEINKLSIEWEKIFQNYVDMKQESSELDLQISEDTNELNELKIQIEEITTRQLKLTKIQRRMEAEEELDETDIMSKRKRLNNSIFINEILDEAINNTLYEINLDYLEPITQKITEIWGMIFNDEDRNVSFDQNLNPILKTKRNEISFNNLSGGEKTFLTIITRSLLMHQFSNIEFTILDEPLEHLDIINRAQLIEFLLKFYNAELTEQLIITTFEESLTRYLLDTKDVSIISLGSIRKYPEILEKE